MISCSENGEIKFWPFKDKKILNQTIAKSFGFLKLEETTIDKIRLHRESGLLSVATDDYSIIIVDCDSRKVIRKFSGHSNQISDMSFSADSRWLISASMDCLIKVWDLPRSKLIDCFRFEKAPTSVCFSPTSEFLATTHVNDLGVYLWSNKTLYSHVSLKQLPDDYDPTDYMRLPSTHFGANQKNTEGEIDSEGDDSNYKSYVSPEQLDYELVSLSLLPDSRWKSLVNLDIIKV
jgi:U3 small nucleolar RNA-associated protein 21